METIRKYKWNEVVWEKLNVGDTVQLPEFTVSETTIKGNKELYFEEHKIKDTATVYNIKDDKIYLVFNHALFKSPMDLNNATDWERTQLNDYLSGAFRNSMKDVDIPALEVSLFSKDDVFGENAFPFFKNGRNRIVFMDDEECVTCYWLKDTTATAYFYYGSSFGYASHGYASSANLYVRPCLIVKKEE